MDTPCRLTRTACPPTETKRRLNAERGYRKLNGTEGTIFYRPLKPDETADLAACVLKVFTEFVAPLYAREGVAAFKKFIAPDLMSERLAAGNIVWVAASGSKIVGVIEMRENRHIALLFVDASCQRQGIARELIRRAVAVCRERAPGLHTIAVNASPNAVPAYCKLGFQPAGEEQTVNGIRFIPMARVLDGGN
jgi:GNAT superfamily N-acetyltransferase